MPTERDRFGISGEDSAVLSGLGDLMDLFDVFVLDQWGVLHEGNQLYEGVLSFLDEIKRTRKQVFILTNSSKSSSRNIQRLEDRFGLAATRYDDLISSADIIREWLEGAYPIEDLRVPRSVFVLADEGDEQLLSGLNTTISVDIEKADAVILLSLPVADTPEDHLPWMVTGADRGVPLICPSSDVLTVRPNGVYAGMNSVISRFLQLGGDVHNFGKPSHHVYDICRRRMRAVSPAKVLMVGDQIASDVIGAKAQGWTTALVQSGAGQRALAGSKILPDYVVESLRL
jgi:HAD superfamily hydrolase (TIGR01459 family)